MELMDADAISKHIAQGRDRLRALGVSEKREQTYYEQLSGTDEFRDDDQDARAFETAIVGLELSPLDREFVRQVLDSGDGR
jgi:hypothetical protein